MKFFFFSYRHMWREQFPSTEMKICIFLLLIYLAKATSKHQMTTGNFRLPKFVAKATSKIATCFLKLVVTCILLCSIFLGYRNSEESYLPEWFFFYWLARLRCGTERLYRKFDRKTYSMWTLLFSLDNKTRIWTCWNMFICHSKVNIKNI